MLKRNKSLEQFEKEIKEALIRKERIKDGTVTLTLNLKLFFKDWKVSGCDSNAQIKSSQEVPTEVKEIVAREKKLNEIE